MRVLIVEVDVIGTVYGAHLAAGNTVSVLSHRPGTDATAARGLSARDVVTGRRRRLAGPPRGLRCMGRCGPSDVQHRSRRGSPRTGPFWCSCARPSLMPSVP